MANQTKRDQPTIQELTRKRPEVLSLCVCCLQNTYTAKPLCFHFYPFSTCAQNIFLATADGSSPIRQQFKSGLIDGFRNSTVVEKFHSFVHRICKIPISINKINIEDNIKSKILKIKKCSLSFSSIALCLSY